MSEPRRFLSKDECAALAERVMRFTRGGGTTSVYIRSWWSGELRWGRNRVTLGADRRNHSVQIGRVIQGAPATVGTNQLDDASLEAAVRAAERNLRYRESSPEDLSDPPAEFEYPKTAIWSDATFDLAVDTRGRMAREMIAPAARQNMLSAGYLEVQAAGTALADSGGRFLYAPSTDAQCSTTVRDSRGTGSGWAGLSSYDWAQLDPQALAARALEKGLASRNPVALEPGRYTVILEPQAVADLVSLVIGVPLSRRFAEGMRGPFALRPDFSKLGLKVADDRVILSHDPTDPMLGVLPFDRAGAPVRPVTWIDRGILTNLAYDRMYALGMLNENLAQPETGAYRMHGGETTVEEMIRTTQRGLLVTRFSNVSVLDLDSLLSTGLTRDGLWLIENGKITKPVKNFRFTESPIFVLNSLEQLGRPVPVFSPGTPVIVPPVKARDFSFTSLADAV